MNDNLTDTLDTGLSSTIAPETAEKLTESLSPQESLKDFSGKVRELIGTNPTIDPSLGTLVNELQSKLEQDPDVSATNLKETINNILSERLSNIDNAKLDALASLKKSPGLLEAFVSRTQEIYDYKASHGADAKDITASQILAVKELGHDIKTMSPQDLKSIQEQHTAFIQNTTDTISSYTDLNSKDALMIATNGVELVRAAETLVSQAEIKVALQDANQREGLIEAYAQTSGLSHKVAEQIIDKAEQIRDMGEAFNFKALVGDPPLSAGQLQQAKELEESAIKISLYTNLNLNGVSARMAMGMTMNGLPNEALTLSSNENLHADLMDQLHNIQGLATNASINNLDNNMMLQIALEVQAESNAQHIQEAYQAYNFAEAAAIEHFDNFFETEFADLGDISPLIPDTNSELNDAEFVPETSIPPTAEGELNPITQQSAAEMVRQVEPQQEDTKLAEEVSEPLAQTTWTQPEPPTEEVLEAVPVTGYEQPLEGLPVAQSAGQRGQFEQSVPVQDQSLSMIASRAERLQDAVNPNRDIATSRQSEYFEDSQRPNQETLEIVNPDIERTGNIGDATAVAAERPTDDA